MKRRILLILSLILVSAYLCLAQSSRRTITNDDLDKYRQTRLKAEADYRANYKNWGMPSPEELAIQEERRQARLADEAAAYRAEKLQQYDLQLRANELSVQQDLANSQRNSQQNYQQSPGFMGGQVLTPGYGGYYGDGYYYGNDYYRRHYFRNVNPLVTTPNVQTVINAANGFPSVRGINNQIYGFPPPVYRGRRR
jgi:hypothetical protein